MAQRRAIEIKVGFFVVLGIGLFLAFLFAIGDLSTYFQPSYYVRVLFDSANGINSGSPVQYAGVEVGKVQDIRLVNPPGSVIPQVEILMRLPTSVKVRADDEASISTFGLLGEKFLEITPGPGHGNLIGSGGSLFGNPPVSTELIMDRSNQVLNELQQTLSGLNTLIGDQEARIFLKEALQEARDATRQWRVFGERINLAMLYAESGKGNLGKLLFDERLYQQMEALVADLREHPWKLLSSPKNQKPDSRK